MKRKIVVIDDDPVILETIQVNLSMRGYAVFAFTSGNEALDELSKIHPDLVILDVMMPDIDGWEVLKIIKDSSQEKESLKVVLLTAKSTSKDRMIGTSILKADDYITKPFDLHDLLYKVKILLGET